MDNSVDRSWATRRAAAFALCAGGLILLGAAVLAAPDAVGLLMMGVAGVLLISFGGYALIIRPRLAIDDATPPPGSLAFVGLPPVPDGQQALSVCSNHFLKTLPQREHGRALA